MRTSLTIKAVLPLCLALVAASGCRGLVLEDRSDCPLFLFYDLVDRGGLEDGDPVVLSVWDASDRSPLAFRAASVGDLADKGFFLTLRKRPEVTAAGVCGLPSGTPDGVDVVSIPFGEEGYPLRRFSASTPGLREEATVPVLIRKDYSRVTVRFLTEDGVFPYSVFAKGSTAGLDLLTGKPIEGPFHCEPRETAPGEYVFIAPRQGDGALTLELFDGTGEHADDLILEDWLSRMEGFSWDLPSLPDIEVRIDFVRAEVIVTVNDWTVAASISLTI